ncbi:SDR family oxidoreductase [Micromonospora halotolerans]|uniref:SDR family oxidoreductase n=1 Tax=Micromonospora halotolerans TaxID=709879 RepID=A0ABY9ZZP3_9ACTN|nr:SDR family oxidoreductase [Micromonospora halotolerans]WNM40798.1 SDR family oxidoreductase [Micromonospora halotolerans]
MERSRILIVGGSSGMGLALAELLLHGGAEVTIAGRSADRLAEAARRLGAPERLSTHPVDITDEEQVRRLAGECGQLDHVVVTAADMTGAYGPLADFDLDAARAVLGTKVLGPWLVAKHVAVAPTGSLTVTSGIAAYRPAPGGSMVATANGALESLVRALALELAPVRVNAVSPGWVDTPIWDTFAGDAKHDRLAAMAERLPGGRVGDPADIARAFVAVLENSFITGTVLHVDGGHRLV